MKYAALATAALLAVASPAFAQGLVSSPPKADDVTSGGHTDSNVAAATGSMQGSVTGEGNMNGPYGNGSPDSPYPTNKAQANMRGVGSHSDPDVPTPAYVGQAPSQ